MTQWPVLTQGPTLKVYLRNTTDQQDQQTDMQTFAKFNRISIACLPFLSLLSTAPPPESVIQC